MKISKLYPPHWDFIGRMFPEAKEYKAIFAFGDTIYNPFGAEITPDLEVHEEVHSKQQGDNPFDWWYRYATSKDFRLSQELDAYAKQYRFVIDTLGSSKLTDWLLDKCAESLSSELYGLNINYGEARSKIRNKSKKILLDK
jgi:hypothetical protein